MSEAEQRTIAIAAIRSWMREMDIDPVAASATETWIAFNGLSEHSPLSIAGRWWIRNWDNDNQCRLFWAGFSKWQQSQKEIAR